MRVSTESSTHKYKRDVLKIALEQNNDKWFCRRRSNYFRGRSWTIWLRITPEPISGHYSCRLISFVFVSFRQLFLLSCFSPRLEIRSSAERIMLFFTGQLRARHRSSITVENKRVRDRVFRPSAAAAAVVEENLLNYWLCSQPAPPGDALVRSKFKERFQYSKCMEVQPPAWL